MKNLSNNKLYSISVSKQIKASPKTIWATWTDPKQYTAVHDSYKAEIDFRVGGSARVTYFKNKYAGETLKYLDIELEKKLVFCWQEAEQNHITLLLEPEESYTKVSLTQNCYDNPEWINTCLQGWAWILDSLENYIIHGKGITCNNWAKEHGKHKVIST